MSPILSRLIGRSPLQPALQRPLREVQPCESGVADVPATDGEREHRCGWFDSSHDLRSGLWVREHLDPDEIAAALPLSWWLALHEASRPAAAMAIATATATATRASATGIIAACH